MTNAENRELQVREKQEVAGAAEQTKPGPVFIPAVDIYETENEVILMADMSGVTAENLNIDLRENTLTLSGEIEPFETADEEDISIEYEVGRYFRQFTISEAIDQEKIKADLKNGVLQLTLPKAEKIKPRKITVTT